jgi:hypothetical protein
VKKWEINREIFPYISRCAPRKRVGNPSFTILFENY